MENQIEYAKIEFIENESYVEENESDTEENELTIYEYISNHLYFEYFVGYEIATLLGYNNPNSAIINIVSKCNQLVFRDYPGVKIPKLNPKTVLITRDGVIEIILKTRKIITPDVLHILKKFNIDTTNKKCLTKEQQTFLAITNAFKTEKFEDQYKIGKYYLDLYFPDYKIVVECDENGHVDRKPYKERERMDYINETLEIDDDNWIRYNPDEENFDITKVIGKIYNKIIEQKNIYGKIFLRKCNKCFIKKDLTNDFFSKKGTGFRFTCIECVKEDENKFRTCDKCNIKKDLTNEFFAIKGTAFRVTCKECINENGNEKQIRQYDLDGNFIKEFNSIKKASTETGILDSQISSNCRGKVKSAGKYMWKFVTEKDDEENIEAVKYDLYKTVAQYNTNGEFIKKYKSVGEACKELNFNTRSIYSAIKNNFISYGFIWKYVENNEIIEKIQEVTPHRKYMKQVNIYKDNILYKSFISIKEASVNMKVNISMCRKFLSGVKKDPSNFEWKFKTSE